MEMMLALAILLAVAGISLPVVVWLSGEHKLKQEAQEIRIKLTGARIHAIDAGVIHQFRYEPHGNRFLIVPYEKTSDDSQDVDAAVADGDSQPSHSSAELPEGMTFQAVESDEFAVEPISEDWLTGLANASQLASADWSPPLLFYPDGSSIDAAFEIIDEKQRSIRISVRGLTGAVSISQVRRESRR